MVVCAKSAFQAGLHNGSKCLHAQHTGQLCCPDPVSGKVPQLTHTCLCDDRSNNNPARSTKTPKSALETEQASTFNSNILLKKQKTVGQEQKSDMNLPVVCRSFTRMLTNSFLFVFLPLAPSCCLYIPSPQLSSPHLCSPSLPSLCTGSTSLPAQRFMWMMLVAVLEHAVRNVIANSCAREEPTWIPLQQDIQSVSDLLMSSCFAVRGDGKLDLWGTASVTALLYWKFVILAKCSGAPHRWSHLPHHLTSRTNNTYDFIPNVAAKTQRTAGQPLSKQSRLDSVWEQLVLCTLL